MLSSFPMVYGTTIHSIDQSQAQAQAQSDLPEVVQIQNVRIIRDNNDSHNSHNNNNHQQPTNTAVVELGWLLSYCPPITTLAYT